jgi:hypothetical protein
MKPCDLNIRCVGLSAPLGGAGERGLIRFLLKSLHFETFTKSYITRNPHTKDNLSFSHGQVAGNLLVFR